MLSYLIIPFLIISAATISCLALDHAASARDLTYIAEQFPPYSFQEDGKLQGASVDLLKSIWERMGEDLNESAIKLLPWWESYHNALDDRNTIVLALARSPEREHLFKWAGPIGSTREVLLARKDRSINIASPEDINKYRIAAIEEDIAVQMLQNMGAKEKDLVLRTEPRSVIEMLKNRSIDAWAYGDIAGIWLLSKSGANVSDYKVVYVLGQTNDYYAFNRETPDSLVQSFQQAIDSIKNHKDENGVSDYGKILSRYIPVTM